MINLKVSVFIYSGEKIETQVDTGAILQRLSPQKEHSPQETPQDKNMPSFNK